MCTHARCVLVSADDIAKRNEAEKLDWQKRGMSGIVAAKTAEEVTLEASRSRPWIERVLQRSASLITRVL